MTKQLFDYIVWISVLSVIAPLIVYLVRFKTHPRQNHFIALYLVSTFSLDIVILVLQLKSYSTILFNNLYSIMSFITLTAFYYELGFKKRFVFLLTMAFVVFNISTIYFAGSALNTKPLTFYWAINASIIVFLSIAYMAILPSMQIERFLDRCLYSNLAINIFILIYFTGAAIIFCFAEFVFTNLTPNEARIFWTSHNILNILKNVGIAVGLFLTGKRDPYISFELFEKLAREKED